MKFRTLATAALLSLATTGAFAQDIAVIAGSVEDAFMDKIKKGVDDATAMVEANGGHVQFLRTQNYENFGPDLVTLINQAVAQGVKGIAIPVWVPDAELPALQAARDAGIVIMQYNSGLPVMKDAGAINYFGSDEYAAGFGGGKYLAEHGAKHILCHIQVPGAINLTERCKGVTEGAAAAGATVTVLETPPNLDGDVTGTAEALKAAFLGDSTIDAMVSCADFGAAAGANHGAGPRDLQVIQHQQRMTGQNQMDQHIRPVKQMLDRVHRQAGPGAGVYRVVVDRMHPFVEWTLMDQPVNAEEMHLVDDRDHQPEDDQGPGMGVECDPRTPTNGPKVQHEDFIGRPDRHPRPEGADHVVDVLTAEHEDVGFAVGGKQRIELEAVPLGSADVKPQLQRSIQDEDDGGIADQKVGNPGPIPDRQRFPGGRGKEPQERAESKEPCIPRQEVMRQPCHKLPRPRRPGKKWGPFEPPVRAVIATPAARAKLQIVHACLPSTCKLPHELVPWSVRQNRLQDRVSDRASPVARAINA